MGYELLEKYNAIIKISEDIIITLVDCDTYQQAYKTLEDYISDQDELRWDLGESMFRFDHAKIEKRFVREWVK